MSQSTLTPTLDELLRELAAAPALVPGEEPPNFRWSRWAASPSMTPAGEAGLEVFLLAVVSETADGGRRTDVVQVPLSYRSEPLPAPSAR